MFRLISALLLVLLPLSGMAVPAVSGGEGGGGKEGESPYLALEPFVVNVQDGGKLRYMQVQMQLMSSSPEVLEVIKNNLPPLRDAMIMLLAHQNAAAMQTMEGREELRNQALTIARVVFANLIGQEPPALPEPKPIEVATAPAQPTAEGTPAEEAMPTEAAKPAEEAKPVEAAAHAKAPEAKGADAHAKEKTGVSKGHEGPGIEALYITDFIIQ